MAKPSRSGPKLPLTRMERAVELRLLGYKWGEIEKRTGTPLQTLYRWQRTPEWKAFEETWLEQDPLARRARAVLAKALDVQLGKKNPDTALAERILAPRGNGDGEGLAGGVTTHRHIVELPLMDRGLKSKPATQVLMPPPAEPAPPAAPPPAPAPGRKRGKPGKRTVVGPDE